MKIKDIEELKKLQKQEAIERLKILENEYKMHPNVLKEFKKNETLYYSESINQFFSGVLYWVSNRDEFVKAIKEIEKKRNIFVYTTILSHTNFGDLLTMLYVSADKDFWDYERNQLKNEGIVDSYVCNLSCDDDSEFGMVQITGVNGGLVRIY